MAVGGDVSRRRRCREAGRERGVRRGELCLPPSAASIHSEDLSLIHIPLFAVPIVRQRRSSRHGGGRSCSSSASSSPSPSYGHRALHSIATRPVGMDSPTSKAFLANVTHSSPVPYCRDLSKKQKRVASLQLLWPEISTFRRLPDHRSSTSTRFKSEVVRVYVEVDGWEF